jgi:hypothetical protein
MRVRSAWKAALVTTRWFRRRWEEPRGDEFDTWGAATYLFEVADDGWPTRQIEDYDNGPTLRYGPDQKEDQYGQLGQARLDELEDWTPWAITHEAFEEAWSRNG